MLSARGGHAPCGPPGWGTGACARFDQVPLGDCQGMRWTPANMPDQTGKTVVITGANSGIGYHAALHLAKAGADVVLACRRLDAAEEAAARINAVAPGRARAAHLDLADLDSVAAFAARAPASIDVLINNAGIMMVPHARTPQGHESQWGVNVVGHAALTHALLPRIKERVVTISSLAHRHGRIDPGSFDGAGDYHPWHAYAQSKLGDLLFSFALDRHLREQGSPVRSVAAHPGVSLTRLHKDMPWALKLLLVPYVPFLQSSNKGSWPTLYAATMDVPSGSYWGPRGRREHRGSPAAAHVARRAQDPDAMQLVWDAVWPGA